MKTKLTSAARLILLLAGAIVLTLIVYVLFHRVVRRAGTVIFLIYVALSVYAIAVLPLVFSFRMNDGVLLGGIIFYRGVILFAVLSAAVFLFTLLRGRVTAMVIVFEIIAIFILFLYLFLTYRVADHAMNVGDSERQKKAALEELKTQTALLRGKAGVLGEEAEPVKQWIDKLAENVRYLSPSDTPQAAELEKQLLDAIMTLDVSNLSPQRMQDVDLLYRQRKAL